jgi:hypothetical protein
MEKEIVIIRATREKGWIRKKQPFSRPPARKVISRGNMCLFLRENLFLFSGIV